MKRIACIGYRGWAMRIYEQLASDNLKEYFPKLWLQMEERSPICIRSLPDPYTRDEYIRFKELYLTEDGEYFIDPAEYDLILWYGWSERIPDVYVKAENSIMLHPSKLPEYRGGSPIQNQIIDGVEESAVTLFIVADKVDEGDIVAQTPFSLSGSLDDILSRLSTVGYQMTRDIIDNGYTRTVQDSSKATYCKRRKPEQSEITIDELSTMSGMQLYDKVRCLQKPYPQAFIRMSNGDKVYINSVSMHEENGYEGD